MIIMLSRKKKLFNLVTTILLSVLSVAVFHFIYLDRIYYTFDVQVDYSAQKDDVAVFYSPDRNGNYRQSHSSQVTYLAGETSVTFPAVIRNVAQPLRFDPGVVTNIITIQQISFTRFNRVESMDAEQLEKCIAKSIGVSHKLTQEGLELTFTEGDPQLFLSGYSLPSSGRLKLCSYAIFIFILCLILSAFLHNRSPHQPILYHLRSMAVMSLLVIAGYFLSWPFSIVLTIFFVFVYSLLCAKIFIEQNGFKGISDFSFGPFLVITCFLLLLIWPFYQAISPGSSLRSKGGDAILTALKDVQKNGSHTEIKSLIHTIDENVFGNFPYRMDLIHLNANIKIFFWGYSPTPKAILGKDGMFFEGYGKRRVESDIVGSFDNITDYMGLIPFTQEELEEWLVCVEERYYWLKEQGIDYVFALAPSKALIYPEKLPSRIYKTKVSLNAATRYEQLVKYLKQRSVVPIVDLKNALLKGKNAIVARGDDDLLLYYKTDFHWNYYGSFLAYQAIVDEINSAYPNYQFAASQLDEFTVHKRTDWVHYRFIYALGLDPVKHTNETYLTFFPKPGSSYSSIGEFSSKGINDYSSPESITKNFGRSELTYRELENEKAKTPMIFVMGDSFSGKYFGYFSKHAQKTLFFRSVYSFPSEVFVEAAPSLVIQEILNMYLLEKPPRNPDIIKKARIDYLNASSTLAENKKKD